MDIVNRIAPFLRSIFGNIPPAPDTVIDLIPIRKNAHYLSQVITASFPKNERISIIIKIKQQASVIEIAIGFNTEIINAFKRAYKK